MYHICNILLVFRHYRYRIKYHRKFNAQVGTVHLQVWQRKFPNPWKPLSSIKSLPLSFNSSISISKMYTFVFCCNCKYGHEALMTAPCFSLKVEKSNKIRKVLLKRSWPIDLSNKNAKIITNVWLIYIFILITR